MLQRSFKGSWDELIRLWDQEGLKALKNYTLFIQKSCEGGGRLEFRGKFCLVEEEKELAPEHIVRKAIRTCEPPARFGHLNPFMLYQKLRSEVPGVSDGKYEEGTKLFYFDLHDE